jgi:hypothetical protein
MGKVASILCAAMGWTNSHAHALRVGDGYFTMLSEDSDEDEIYEDEVTVSPSEVKFAVCLDGQNARPPEDVGGPGGYAHFLEAITNHDHDEHDSYLEWVGGSFDPAEFDLAGTNERCQKIR